MNAEWSTVEAEERVAEGVGGAVRLNGSSAALRQLSKSVRVPDAMRILREGDSLTVSFPSYQTTNLTVGHKMVTGITSEDRVIRNGVGAGSCGRGHLWTRSDEQMAEPGSFRVGRPPPGQHWDQDGDWPWCVGWSTKEAMQ